MDFAHLRRLANENQIDEHDFALNDEPQETVLYPSDADFIATVYFDGVRYRNGAGIDPVMEQYAARYPDRIIHPEIISTEDLARHPYLSSARAERTFISRGYVSNLEDRQVPAGNHDTWFAKAHKDVVKAEAFVAARTFAQVNGREGGINALYDPTGEQGHLPRHPLAPITGSDIGLTDEQLADALPIWRKEFEAQTGWESDDRADPDYLEEWNAHRRKKKTPRPFAMVEANGMMLGRSRVNADDAIRMAYSGTPESFIHDGRAVINGNQWTRRSSREIEERLQLELFPETTAEFFDARHWPSLRVGGDGAVSPDMVLTWQSQALASLRKVAWRASADGSAAIINNALRAERLAPTLDGGRPRRPIGAARVDQQRPRASFRDAVRVEVERYVDALDRLGSRGAGVGNVEAAISHRDLLIASFCGMRYDSTPSDTPPDEIYEIAFWLGSLRRHGQAVMDCWFRDSIVEHVDGDPLRDLLFSALSERAWEVLLDAAQDLARMEPGGGVDTSRTINVTYSWSQGPEPWTATRDGDNIAITGPLLYFPVSERALWAEKAEFIRDNQGFVAPAP